MRDIRDIRIACFSAQGESLGVSLGLGDVTRFPAEVSLKDWTRRAFLEADALIYIGACAIAVRSIAPFVKSKLSDPAVISMDETGAYVIPILSGHIGGANELARQIAGMTNGCPVITTATDRRRTFAADSWAVENGFGIVNPEAVKTISSAVLDGQEIVLSVRDRGDDSSLSLSAKGELHLVPRNIVVGIGCRRGTDPEYLESCFLDFSRRHSIEPASVGWIASIDLKSEEKAIRQLSTSRKMPFLTYSARQLMEVQGEFTSSEFVRKTTGVDNVCERAAMRAAQELAGEEISKGSGELICSKEISKGSGELICPKEISKGSGELICSKEIYEGVTLAAARLNRTAHWQWV